MRSSNPHAGHSDQPTPSSSASSSSAQPSLVPLVPFWRRPAGRTDGPDAAGGPASTIRTLGRNIHSLATLLVPLSSPSPLSAASPRPEERPSYPTYINYESLAEILKADRGLFPLVVDLGLLEREQKLLTQGPLRIVHEGRVSAYVYGVLTSTALLFLKEQSGKLTLYTKPIPLSLIELCSSYNTTYGQNSSQQVVETIGCDFIIKTVDHFLPNHGQLRLISESASHWPVDIRTQLVYLSHAESAVPSAFRLKNFLQVAPDLAESILFVSKIDQRLLVCTPSGVFFEHLASADMSKSDPGRRATFPYDFMCIVDKSAGAIINVEVVFTPQGTMLLIQHDMIVYLYSVPDELMRSSEVVPPQLPQIKVNSDVVHFTAGLCDGRNLVALVKDPLRSIPIDHSIRIWEITAEGVEGVESCFFPAEILSIDFFGKFMFVGCHKGIHLIQIDMAKGALAAMGPLISDSNTELQFITNLEKQTIMGVFRLSDGDYLLCYPDYGVFINRTRQRSQTKKIWKMSWLTRPIAMKSVGDALVVCTEDVIEIRSLADGSILQIVRRPHSILRWIPVRTDFDFFLVDCHRNDGSRQLCQIDCRA
ncbi:CNH domain-containing protein [Polychytrium aggregatum]|uniref:CNH domain-containing protein n=1 Tax=Polychytrium aggregatum TaxID=110093 RepID=UPI0022FDC902|nr:CNH domain-containing protein [Polychytrium aggregatum]KAI9205436.1 CNH domain-containing protein [Polychytrium aggregatum]